jgi:mono/diheme cytochrome c family protein
MREWLFVTGMAVALVAIAVPGARSETAADSVAALSLELGKSDFRTYCAACHGVSGNGDGTVAEFLTIAAPDLTTLTKRNGGTFPRQRLSEVIDGRAEVKVHGPRDMPVWGEWFDYEAMSPDTDRDAREIIVRLRIEALISYVESIQQK